jgi:hypothetical protein
MAVSALLSIEPLTLRKTLGVSIAVLGVMQRCRLSTAPPGGARRIDHDRRFVLCMAFYNVWSRPFIRRPALGFHGVGMGTVPRR